MCHSRPGIVVLWLTVLAAVVGGQSCEKFGGGSCCPDLDPIDDFASDLGQQPFYYKVLPKTKNNEDIDNICLTYFPLPDDPQTFLIYVSSVYSNGYNKISSFISNQPLPGVRRLGSALYSFSVTVFGRANHTNIDPACDVLLSYKCFLRGDYVEDELADAIAPVMGLSDIRNPISRSCLNSVEFTIRNSGLPQQDYLIPPMRLPSRCILNQVCTIQPARQRFRQAVGLAFPSLGY